MRLHPGCWSGRQGWGQSGTSCPGGFIPSGPGSLGGVLEAWCVPREASETEAEA